MSNIKIAYADIGWNAADITPSASISTVGDKAALTRGHRQVISALDTAATSYSIVYDLGVAGTAQASDYLIVSRADMLKVDGVTAITLDRSSNGSTWTTEHTVTTPASYSLVGTRSTEIFDTFTLSTAYRYWRISMSGSSNKFRHSKHYFGSLFDFGDDPVSFSSQVVTPTEPERASAGNLAYVRTAEPYYEYAIKWSGVTDVKIESATSKFLQYRNPVYIVTTTNHEILNNYKCIHCQIDRGATRINQIYTDYNEIEIRLKEQLG